MNILFLSYWNLTDSLTTATVLPSLSALNSFSWVKTIVFVNIERKEVRQLLLDFESDKVIYKPFVTKLNHGFWREKIHDYMKGPKFIIDICKAYKINAIIARGAPAGGLAYLASRKTQIPFIVESFEPHSDYMYEPGIWKWYDPRLWISKYLESKQKKFALGLMPVAFNYANKLMEERIDQRNIQTVPCFVNRSLFSFSLLMRNKTRDQLKLKNEDVVGIYAGRYGGLYMKKEAFDVYDAAFSYFKNRFFLIILAPSEYHEWIQNQIEKRGLPAKRIFVKEVFHNEVPDYLSASDFGIATYTPGKSKAYLSPVKIAEYWANGLPVILTEGVGDETQLITNNPQAGILFSKDKIIARGEIYFEKLASILCETSERNKLAESMLLHREAANIQAAYRYFLEPLIH